MGRIFTHITQFRSTLTQGTVEFLVRDGLCPIRDLPPGKTRKVKQSRILRCCRESGSKDWRICILIDGRFTGMELSPLDVLKYTRIVISDEWNGDRVVCVKGIWENKTSDHLLRLMFFGCMRNVFWDKRPSVLIDRFDSQVATKLRKIEGVSPHQFSPSAGTIVVSWPIASPTTKKIDEPVKLNPQENGKIDGSKKEERNINYFSNTPPKESAPKNKEKIPINSPPQEGSIPRRRRGDLTSMNTDNRPVRGEAMGRNREYVMPRGRAPVVQKPVSSFVHVILLLLAFTFVCLTNILLIDY